MGSDSSSESKQLPTSINDDEVSFPPSISDEESPSHSVSAEYESPTAPYEALRIGSDSDGRCSEDMDDLRLPVSQGADDEGINVFDDAKEPDDMWVEFEETR